MRKVKKLEAIFYLMKLLVKEKEISSHDKGVLSFLNCSQKTLERYLSEIEHNFCHIIKIKRSKQYVWKLITLSDIFKEFIINSDKIGELFLIARDYDPEIFKDLELSTLNKIAKKDDSIFIFKNYIMETLQDEKYKQIFQSLKAAVKNSEYRDIIYHDDSIRVIKNAKPLKLLFINNNWYVAIVKNEHLELLRIVFIQEIKYSSKMNYTIKNKENYINFLQNIQNALTLYGVYPKKAIIKALPPGAKYFDKDMKKYFTTQTFLSKESDGSVLFSVEYTQELEILPIIQKWMPHLIVLEPKELKEAYIQKLQKTLQNIQSYS